MDIALIRSPLLSQKKTWVERIENRTLLYIMQMREVPSSGRNSLSLSLLSLFWHSLSLFPPFRVDSLLLLLSLHLFSTLRFRRAAPGSRRKQVVSATPATYGACGLLQICRSLAKIQERCRKRRRRRRTRGRKESSRIRVTCDSLCT